MKLYKKIRQFGGLELLKEYIKKGVLLDAVKQLVAVVFRRKSLGQADSELRKLIAPKLRAEFFPIMKNIERKYAEILLPQKRSNKVWFCWMQGLQQAPDVVKMCYASLKRHLKDKEIIVLTSDNIYEYVSFPEFIMEKHRKGILDYTRLADLARLELLIKYGGTWVDSTVLCTSGDFPKDLMDSDLFVFQIVRKNYTGFVGLSNWFITACTNNRILLILREMHYEYWKRYSCVVDYFFFHLFFIMIAQEYSEEIEKMPKYSNRYPLLLATKLADEYDEEWMNKLCQRTCFHKLTYRLKGNPDRPGTFYDALKRLQPI